MKPQTIGRALGIGLRVAGRVAGQRIAAGAQTNGMPPSGTSATTQAAASARTSPRTAERTKGLTRGIGGFLRPFGRVGSIVFLEVAGVFFFLFVLICAQTLWRTRASFAHGPDHFKFIVAAVLLAGFLYLGVSSFWRARRK